MAGGRFYAALTAMLYWISNPLWIGGTLAVSSIAAIKTFCVWQYQLSIWGHQTQRCAYRDGDCALFHLGHNLVRNYVFARWQVVVCLWFLHRLGLLGVFIVLGIVFIVGGYSKGAHFGTADLLPSDWGLVVSAIFPVLIFQWVGFEVQSGAAEEMHDPQRDVPRSLIRAGAIAVITYVLFLVVILFALPKNQLTGVGSFLNAYQSVAKCIAASNCSGPGLAGCTWLCRSAGLQWRNMADGC